MTAAQERPEGDALQELPQILIAADAPPRPGSAEALRLLATAKGSSGYDETFPSTPEPEVAPRPFNGQR